MKLPEKNRVEWTVFAASLALITVLVGILVRHEFARPATPPELHARATATRAAGQGFAVGVEVENRGGETAASVVIEVEMIATGGSPERGELQIAFVPHGATRKGEVMFTRDPSGATLRARVLGYERP